MDAFAASLWLLRFLFLALLYLFLFAVVRVLVRDLRSAAREPQTVLGRLQVISSPEGEPPPGAVISLDAVTTLGRDVNNTIVVDDPFASSAHARIFERGDFMYIEDMGSTNGTYLNVRQIRTAERLKVADVIRIGDSEYRYQE